MRLHAGTVDQVDEVGQRHADAAQVRLAPLGTPHTPMVAGGVRRAGVLLKREEADVVAVRVLLVVPPAEAPNPAGCLDDAGVGDGAVLGVWRVGMEERQKRVMRRATRRLEQEATWQERG